MRKGESQIGGACEVNGEVRAEVSREEEDEGFSVVLTFLQYCLEIVIR